MENRPDQKSLGTLTRLFLKLGIIGFGGPAAHIAMMEDEVVSRRGWMERSQFLDLVGATIANAINKYTANGGRLAV